MSEELKSAINAWARSALIFEILWAIPVHDKDTYNAYEDEQKKRRIVLDMWKSEFREKNLAGKAECIEEVLNG